MNGTQKAEMACDVLVIGSGASGLATAVTAAHHGLKVIVAEKADVFGGTSAWSGGWLWIPRNPLAVAAGIKECRDGPRTYLRSELGNRANDPRLEVFLENGPEMVSFFAQNSAIDWIDGNKVPDFHATEGSVDGGRSVSVAPYDARNLGEWVNKLRPPLSVVSLWGMGIAGGADMGHFFNATRKTGSAIYAGKRIAKHLLELVSHGRGMTLVNGNSLVARLMRTALDLGVTLIDSAPAKELVKDGDRITGAVMTINGQDVTISAQKAVVLATGGFPHDKARQAEQFDHTPSGEGHHSAAPKTNTGDGMRMAESAGAALDFTLSQPGAWAPVSRVPDGKGGYINFPHLIERAKPGVMAVDASGKRFVNEADSYHDFMKALLDRHPKGETPHCWLIADHRTQRRWGLGWSRPFPFPVSKYVKNGYLKRGRTLAELARACDLPQDAFTKTIARFNDHARKGVDPDFQRGASRYNRVQGDMTHQPNPSLGPVEKGPFYAVKIVPGSLGTFAGLKTTALGQVLSTDGIPIKGLFSVGNDMASVMGGNYPSGGITLGPGMTFGYVIGRTLAGQPVTAAPSSSSSTTSEDQ